MGFAHFALQTVIELHDKRQDLKEKDQKRDIARAMKDY